ncbi:unnamed protein product, partial [Phaeothamnion confervicola]
EEAFSGGGGSGTQQQPHGQMEQRRWPGRRRSGPVGDGPVGVDVTLEVGHPRLLAEHVLPFIPVPPPPPLPSAAPGAGSGTANKICSELRPPPQRREVHRRCPLVLLCLTDERLRESLE